jgi:AcrR family transcriptional regulator
MEEVIINKARDLFFSYGLKSVSMDDLARKSGTSKKTIYQLVADKNELVDKVVEDLVRCHTEALGQCTAEARNAVEEVMLRGRVPFVTLASVNRNFFYELEKFFPFAWSRLITHRRQVMVPAIVANLERGVSEGHYRGDLNKNLIAGIRLQQIITALDPKEFTGQNISTQQLMNDLTEFYLHAITNNKGKQLLNKYLNGNNENQQKS